jgi:WD40 repeat protein
MQHEEISLLEDSLYADLYQRHAPGLFAYAYQQTTSREDAEDIVLDVFLSVLQNPRFPTFDEKKQEAWLSPNGIYLALQKSDHHIEFWNIDTGKLVSTTSSSVAGNSQPIAWSPNGASLAVGIGSANWPAAPGEVQIWSTATGQLIASFTDSDTFEGDIGGLAWSPNGKYLAESSAEIHIWDVAARQLVATFGKVATKTTSSHGKATIFSQIISVAWAPDGSMLASVTVSSTHPSAPGSSGQDTLNVWQLL